jgi:MFS family permease
MARRKSAKAHEETTLGTSGAPGPLRLLLNRGIGLYEIARGRGTYYNDQERNIALLYLDIAAASILSAAASFNSAFALRLGASNALIGLMTSLPALITMLGMIPASAVVEGQSKRWRAMLRSLGITRILFIPAAFIPWLLPAGQQAVALAALLILRNVPILVFSAGWDSALADIIPPRLRSQVFSWRNILATAAVVVALLLIRPWLQWASFPLNYQVVYFVGGLGGMLSLWFLMRMRVPDVVPLARREGKRGFRLADVRQVLSGQPQYVRFVVNTLIGNAGAFLASPVYMIFYVRALHASDGWIASSTLVANLSTMLGYLAWRRLLPRFGESRTLRVTWPLTGLLPLLIGISTSLNVVLLVIFVYGLVTPGLNLSHYNTLLEACPQQRRPMYISVYSSLVNVFAFILPMAGVALADSIGLTWTLVIAGSLWIVGGLSFSLLRIHVADVSRGEQGQG